MLSALFVWRWRRVLEVVEVVEVTSPPVRGR